MSQRYEVVVTQNDFNSLNHSAASGDIEIGNHFPRANESSKYSEEVQIKQSEAILVDDKMAMLSSVEKHQKNRSSEINSKLTYISINSTSPTIGAGEVDNQRENQVKIFSSVNSDSIISTNQMSPSKIRIFVPYKSESNDNSMDSSTNKDMPTVET